MSDFVKLGQEAEAFVAHLLVERGCYVLSRNFRRKGAELDIVALRRRSLYIVEVKYRRKPVEFAFEIQMMLARRKILALKRGCDYFRKNMNVNAEVIRFDLAVVSGRPEAFRIQYYPNIFEYN